jgi:hypothetical protein
MLYKYILKVILICVAPLSIADISSSSPSFPPTTDAWWAAGNTVSDLNTCQAIAAFQSQTFFMIHGIPSSSDGTQITSVYNDFLLNCIYGLDAVNQADCIGHTVASGTCTPTALTIPTTPPVPTTTVNPIRSNVYGG